jgi:hypothetical protein
MSALPIILALMLAGPSAIPRSIIHTDATIVGHGSGGTVPLLPIVVPLSNTGTLECSPGAISCVTFDGRHNLITSSGTIVGGTGPWVVTNFAGTSQVANAALAPDGSNSATLLGATASAGTSHGVFLAFTYAATPYTWSMYLKAGTYNCAVLDFANAANRGATFNVSAGTVGYTDAGVSAGISPVAGYPGWFRAWITGTQPAGGGFPEVYLSQTCSTNVRQWNALGTENLYVWGADLEQYSTTPHAYVPTTAAAVTSVPLESGSGAMPWAVQGVPAALQTNQTPATGAFGAAGPFSDANYYSSGTGSDPLDSTGDRYGCAAYTLTDTLQHTMTNNGLAAVSGYGVQQAAGGAWQFFSNGPATAIVTTADLTTLNGLNVGCWWRTGTSISAKLNLGTTAVNAAAGTEVAGTAYVAKIGRYELVGLSFAGQILGVVQGLGACPTPPSPFAATCEGWATYQMTRALGALGTQATNVTVTRSTPQTYLMPGFGTGQLLWTAPVNSLAVDSNGAEIYAASTNYALQSETSCVAGAVQTPWTLAGTPTCTTDTALAPNGTMTMDAWTNATNTHGITQTLTTPASATFTYSAWASKAATGPVSLGVACTAGTAIAPCTCGTSDGSACSTNFGGATCLGNFTAVGLSPVRVWTTATCLAALTNPTISFTPGQNGVSTGTANFWGVAVTATPYPMPYTPTTTLAVAQSATVATVPLPALHLTNNWCIGISATPGPGSGWSVPASTLIGLGTVGAANSAYISRVYFGIYDSAANQKYIPHAAGTRFVLAATSGSAVGYVDGVAIPLSVGTGTNLWSASPALAGIGAYPSGVNTFDGALANLKIKVNPTLWTDCQ